MTTTTTRMNTVFVVLVARSSGSGSEYVVNGQ
jgi:hypothetical protein